MLVLRDRNLTGLAEDKTTSSTVNNPGGCSNPQTSPEMKPHSYLDAIRTGLNDLEASSSYRNEQQLCPYAAAGECRFGDACVYLHEDMCEICRLQIIENRETWQVPNTDDVMELGDLFMHHSGVESSEP